MPSSVLQGFNIKPRTLNQVHFRKTFKKILTATSTQWDALESLWYADPKPGSSSAFAYRIYDKKFTEKKYFKMPKNHRSWSFVHWKHGNFSVRNLISKGTILGSLCYQCSISVNYGPSFPVINHQHLTKYKLAEKSLTFKFLLQKKNMPNELSDSKQNVVDKNPILS